MALKKITRSKREGRIEQDDKWAELTPYDGFKVNFSIDFEHHMFKKHLQTSTIDFSTTSFLREVSRARTFGFTDQIDDLYERELALGGSHHNAILIDGDTVVNDEGLRFHDEFVRHKVLDIVGELAPAGVPVIGHFYGYKPGHALNQALLRKFISDEQAWSYVMLDEYEDVPGLRRLSDALATTANRVRKAWSRLRVVA